MLIALDSVNFGYTNKTLVHKMNLQLDPDNHLDLMDHNNTDKTTLLKLLSDELKPETNKVYRTPNLKITHLRQTQETLTTATVLDAALEPLADVMRLEQELARVTEQMAHDPSLAERYGVLQDLFERRSGYSAPSQAKKVLSDLDFTNADHDKPPRALSDGEKNRLALAQLLLTNASVLLLDEPTNHLDVDATEFLEDFLSSDHS